MYPTPSPNQCCTFDRRFFILNCISIDLGDGRLTAFKISCLVLRQVKAWIERLKRPPTENAKILFNDTEGSKYRVPQRYYKTCLTKIVLENSFQASRDIPWIMTSQNLFSQRRKVVKLQPKNNCHQVFSETVWTVN